MSQEQYRSCMTTGMRQMPKGISRQDRGMLFCQIAKKCSGKAKSDDEAKHLCSLPKLPKPEKMHRGKKGAPATGGGKACLDGMSLVPHCELQLGKLQKKGVLPQELDLTTMCNFIFE